MFNFIKTPKNKVTTIRCIPFVKNQNFVKQIHCKKKYKSEFHNCMRHTMRLCRWVGFFPVEGLERRSWDKLKFNLISFYGVYYTATVIGQILNTIVCLVQIFNAGVTLSIFTTTMFYFNGFATTLLLFGTAQNWLILVKKAAVFEKTSGIRLNSNASKKLTGLVYMINIFGVVEHCLALNYFLKYVKACRPEYSFYEVLRTYLSPKMPYNIVHSDILKLTCQVFLEITGTQVTFLWSFTDIVIIGMSMYMIEHFNKLNKLTFASKDNDLINWRSLRKQQGNLVQLLHLINNRFKCFVLLSWTSNMYFMAVQLYNSLGFSTVPNNADDCDQKGITEVLRSVDHYVYFFFSFVYLMFKVFTSSLLAANVNAVAREPLAALSEIHHSIYGIEIQRFYRQINYTTIGVNGVFFYITRGTILKVIGLLVTYELMLVQINNSEYRSRSEEFYSASNITSNNTILY